MPDPRDPAARLPADAAPADRDVPRRAPEPPPLREPSPVRETPPPVSEALPPPLPKRPPLSQPPTNLPAPVRAPALPDPSRVPAPLERRLPEHKGKIGRIGDALAGLSEDLKEWVELRIQLVQTEIEEQIAFRAAQAKMGAAAGLFAALGGFFLLVTLALLFGWLFFLLGLSLLLAAFLGFLLLTLLLFLIALVAYVKLKPSPPPSVRSDQSA